MWELWEKWELFRHINGFRGTTSPIRVGARTKSSSDERARRRRPPFLPMAAQHVAFLSGRAHLQRKTTVYDDCDILRQLLAPGSMRNRQQRPGKEHKGLFNVPAFFTRNECAVNGLGC
jgi:hypothetical protein